jgi:hypothetical protein
MPAKRLVEKPSGPCPPDKTPAHTRSQSADLNRDAREVVRQTVLSAGESLFSSTTERATRRDGPRPLFPIAWIRSHLSCGIEFAYSFVRGRGVHRPESGNDASTAVQAFASGDRHGSNRNVPTAASFTSVRRLSKLFETDDRTAFDEKMLD